MKRKLFLLVAATSLVLLTACTEDASQEPKVDTEVEDVAVNDGEVSQGQNIKFDIEHTEFLAENWKQDNTHHKNFKGSINVNDRPVVGAVLQVSDKRKVTTDENGEFTISVDANIIRKDVIHIVSLDGATVDGQPINEEIVNQLVGLSQEVTVYYPITVTNVEPNADNAELVNINAQAVLADGETYPKFGVEKFRISGTIKNADGTPVQNATVNIRRDGVEGFSVSNQSDEKGHYEMFYIPEDDENHYLNVYITEEKKTFTLPENKAFLFPEDGGIELDITLPAEGTIIEDKEPTLVARSSDGGALHKGVLIGVNTDADYTITVPKTDGTFMLTMPKEAWEKNPTFYEINYHEYQPTILAPGSILTKNVIEQPSKWEPNDIKVAMK